MEQKSLLFTLTARQVQSVIDEFDQMKDGYTIHYFIDNYDINLYCFPYGLEKERTVEHVYLFSDGQVSYNHLFKNSSQKPVLIDEYYEEYEALTNKVEEVFDRDFVALKSKVLSFSKRLLTQADITEKDQDFALIRDKLSIIVSIAIGFSSTTLNNFKDLIDKKQLLIERKLQENQHHVPASMKDPLFQTLLRDFGPHIEREVQKYIREHPKASKGEIEATRVRQRMNGYNDAASIYRTIATNDYNLKQGIKQRNYLITSARASSDVVATASREEATNNHSKFDIIRTKAEIFCKLIFQKENLNTSIEELKELKTLLEFKSKFGFTEHAHDQRIVSYLKDIENKRNSLENYGIMVQHNSLLTEFDNALQNLASDSDSYKLRVIQILKKAAVYIEKNRKNAKKWIPLIRLNLAELAYKDDVLRLIAEDPESFKVRAYGLDPIESTNHQVPIVYDHRNIGNDVLNSILNNISFFYTQRSPSNRGIDQFKRELIDGIKTLQGQYSNSLETQIRTFLIYMVIAVPKNPSTGYDSQYKYYQSAYVVPWS